MDKNRFEKVRKTSRGINSPYDAFTNALVVIATRSHELIISPAAYRALGEPTGITIYNNSTEFALEGIHYDIYDPELFKVQALSKNPKRAPFRRIAALSWTENNLVIGGVYVGHKEDGRFLSFRKSAQQVIPMPTYNRKKT